MDQAQRELLDEVLSIPGNAATALDVLRCLDDPTTSAEELGQMLLLDQALSTRAVYMANSTFYGRVNEVAGPAEAATVIGFDTVRSLAASVAFGLFASDALPASYSNHATLTAAAGAVIGPRVGIKRSDALSMGLLHDLGSALLALRRPEQSQEIRQRALADGTSLERLELAEFGIHHGTLGALALRSARFPSEYVEAVLAHHRPLDGERSLASRLVTAADTAALLVDGRWPEQPLDLETCLEDLGLDRDEAPAILSEVESIRPEMEQALAG